MRAQIFVLKVFEPETSRPVIKHNLYLPHLNFAPLSGSSHWNVVQIFCIIKLKESLAYRAMFA